MDFRIADTFTDSLAKLTGDEQKAVKTTAFDLQMNPANPGMSFHKLDKARDKNFWSVRVSSDIRLIVHKTNSSMLVSLRWYRWSQYSYFGKDLYHLKKNLQLENSHTSHQDMYNPNGHFPDSQNL